MHTPDIARHTVHVARTHCAAAATFHPRRHHYHPTPSLLRVQLLPNAKYQMHNARVWRRLVNVMSP
jgi:hypothetical protein